MANFLVFTNRAGDPVHVVPEVVDYITVDRDLKTKTVTGTIIGLTNKDLYVQEPTDDVITKFDEYFCGDDEDDLW